MSPVVRLRLTLFAAGVLSSTIAPVWTFDTLSNLPDLHSDLRAEEL